jgi:GT2 family glycosyltransferase
MLCSGPIQATTQPIGTSLIARGFGTVQFIHVRRGAGLKAFYTNTRPLFSVIIGTHERTAQLSNCLDTLSRCDPSVSFEVIVVDDGRSAGLGALASTTPLRNKLRVLRQSHAGPGAARNTGAEIAEGLYLVFTADDCLPAPDWLAAYALAFERTPHALLGGSVANGLSSNLFSWANSAVVEYLIAYSTHRDGAPRFFTPNNMAVNRERFLEIGGFDVAMGSTGEDREFCERWHRKGLTLRHCPESIVTHERPAHSIQSAPPFVFLPATRHLALPKRRPSSFEDGSPTPFASGQRRGLPQRKVEGAPA